MQVLQPRESKNQGQEVFDSKPGGCLEYPICMEERLGLGSKFTIVQSMFDFH